MALKGTHPQLDGRCGMFIFQIAVSFTDRVNWDGLQFASVLADDDVEATLVAAQLVACRVSAFDGMITGTTVLDCMEV